MYGYVPSLSIKHYRDMMLRYGLIVCGLINRIKDDIIHNFSVKVEEPKQKERRYNTSIKYETHHCHHVFQHHHNVLLCFVMRRKNYRYCQSFI